MAFRLGIGRFGVDGFGAAGTTTTAAGTTTTTTAGPGTTTPAPTTTTPAGTTTTTPAGTTTTPAPGSSLVRALIDDIWTDCLMEVPIGGVMTPIAAIKVKDQNGAWQ